MKLKHSRFDIAMDILSLAILLGTAVYLAVSWGSIPDKIPTHYGLAGEADRWGAKSSLLIPPVFSWVFFTLLTVLEYFPKLWNTGVTVTEENRERVYSTLLHLITSLKLLIAAYFSGMALGSATQSGFPVWFALIGLGLIAADLVYWHMRLKKAK